MITVQIRTEDDILLAVSGIRFLLRQLPFSESEMQSVIVSVLEVTRNILDHAGGNGIFEGHLEGDVLHLSAIDHGPGIPDVEQIMRGDYASPSGLGLGLTGVNRLMDHMQIFTSEKGTRIFATKRARNTRQYEL